MSRFIVHGVPGSPYVRTVLLALEEKGADYRLAALALGGNYEPEYRRMQPFAKIPVLEDGDFRLYETHAILRYLDAMLPEPSLVPTDPRRAARMDQIIGIVDNYVRPHVSGGIGFNRIVRPKFGMPVNEEEVSAAIPHARICVEAVAEIAGDQSFVTGETLSLADLMLAPHFAFFRCTLEGAEMLGRHPALLDWIERMEARPSMQRTEWERLLELAGPSAVAA